MRCLSLPSLPTDRETRAVSRARRSLTATMSLKASAILPSTPIRSDGRRTREVAVAECQHRRQELTGKLIGLDGGGGHRAAIARHRLERLRPSRDFHGLVSCREWASSGF